jgi:hypothetical protein
MFIPLNAKPIQPGRSLFLWGWAEGFNIRNIKYMDARPDLFNRGD